MSAREAEHRNTFSFANLSKPDSFTSRPWGHSTQQPNQTSECPTGMDAKGWSCHQSHYSWHLHNRPASRTTPHSRASHYLHRRVYTDEPADKATCKATHEPSVYLEDSQMEKLYLPKGSLKAEVVAISKSVEFLFTCGGILDQTHCVDCRSVIS